MVSVFQKVDPYARVSGLVLAGAWCACTDGVVRPLALHSVDEAGVRADEGRLSSSKANDGQHEPRPGEVALRQAGDPQRSDGGSWAGAQTENWLPCLTDPEPADRLIEVLNDWIASDTFCQYLTEPLAKDPLVQDAASSFACFVTPPITVGAWWPLPRGYWGWALLAPSFEDAEDALFNTDRSALCDAAADRILKTAAAARVGDRWVVMVSEYAGGDMQSP